MLPTITWGGQEFYDISGIVTPDSQMGGIRPATDGLAIHHTVGQTEFPDVNANGTSLDEMVAHIRAIDLYHRQRYGGFGYNAIVFKDGTVCTVGRMEGKRAHVAFQNWHLGGVAMAGDMTNGVPFGSILGVGRCAAAFEKHYGAREVRGHNDWVAPEHRPQWSTACPGVAGKLEVGRMLMVRDAIMRDNQAALEAEARRSIAEALLPHTLNADLENLANSIKWITGGRLC